MRAAESEEKNMRSRKKKIEESRVGGKKLQTPDFNVKKNTKTVKLVLNQLLK